MTRLRSFPQSFEPHEKDITGKFAEMSLTPSQHEVAQTCNVHRTRKRFQCDSDPRIAHRILVTGKVHKCRRSKPPKRLVGVLKYHDNGLPMPVYNIVKQIVDALDRLKTHPDDVKALDDLEDGENGIEIASTYFKGGNCMPSDWEYERDNAHDLLK